MTEKKKTRNPFIAALLSLLAPGLGQIYNSKGALGIVFFVFSAALPFLWGLAGWPRHFSGLVTVVLAAVVFWLFVIVHAFIQARRIKETELKKYQTIAVYAFFIILSLGSIFVPARIWMTSLLGISPYRMATASMMPTLQKGDFLMTDPKAYNDQAPKRGDLVVIEYPRDPTKQFLMRVISVEGETVEIKNKQVFIANEPLQESYKVQEDIAIDNSRDNFGPLKIPAGHCFVLGDNRDDSNDGRYWGALPLANVKGQALYIYWAKDKKRIGLTLKYTTGTSEAKFPV